MDYDFMWIKNFYYQHSFEKNNELICGMFMKIERIINEKNIQFIYPKYLFVDGCNLELYLFLKSNCILKCSVENENYINISTFYISNIENVSFTESCKDDRDNILKIKFNNGEIFEFNGMKDTNEHHKYGFGKLTQELCKYIINSYDSQ